jgi:hypothetical protein
MITAFWYDPGETGMCLGRFASTSLANGDELSSGLLCGSPMMPLWPPSPGVSGSPDPPASP